jgi:hypothetical protein
MCSSTTSRSMSLHIIGTTLLFLEFCINAGDLPERLKGVGEVLYIILVGGAKIAVSSA